MVHIFSHKRNLQFNLEYLILLESENNIKIGHTILRVSTCRIYENLLFNFRAIHIHLRSRRLQFRLNSK